MFAMAGYCFAIPKGSGRSCWSPRSRSRARTTSKTRWLPSALGAFMGCEAERIRKAVQNFKAVEHRLEYVATIRGVEYYNDSKATNVDATIKALESFRRIFTSFWAARTKTATTPCSIDLLRQRVKRVYTIGAAAEKIESQVKAAAEIVPCGDTGDGAQACRGDGRGRRYCAAGSGMRQFRPVQEL